MSNELKRILNEAVVVAYACYYRSNCLEGLRKTTESSIRFSRCPSRDSNQTPPEYISRTSPSGQPARKEYFNERVQVILHQQYCMAKCDVILQEQITVCRSFLHSCSDVDRKCYVHIGKHMNLISLLPNLPLYTILNNKKLRYVKEFLELPEMSPPPPGGVGGGPWGRGIGR
jgi:hypothetical protein